MFLFSSYMERGFFVPGRPFSEPWMIEAAAAGSGPQLYLLTRPEKRSNASREALSLPWIPSLPLPWASPHVRTPSPALESVPSTSCTTKKLPPPFPSEPPFTRDTPSFCRPLHKPATH